MKKSIKQVQEKKKIKNRNIQLTNLLVKVITFRNIINIKQILKCFNQLMKINNSKYHNKTNNINEPSYSS